MKPRVFRINRLVSNYDSRLFATERNDGCVVVWRKGDRWGVLTDSSNPDLARFIPQPILALTDDWQLTGRPVEWGLTPLYFKLREMDSHRDDSIYDQILEERRKAEESRAFSRHHENRAYAADVRKDFAKAFNDFNVSSL